MRRLEFREHEQVGRDVVQAQGIAADDLQESRVVRVVVDGAVQQRFGVTRYRSQRSAQLMRHVGHEVPPHALEVFAIRNVSKQRNRSRFASAPQGRYVHVTKSIVAGCDANSCWCVLIRSDELRERIDQRRIPEDLYCRVRVLQDGFSGLTRMAPCAGSTTTHGA